MDGPKPRKITVALVVFDDCFSSGPAGVADMLMAANAVSSQQYGSAAPVFDWRYVSENQSATHAANRLIITPDAGLDHDVYDLVFVAAPFYSGRGAFRNWLKQQRVLAGWLACQWRSGAVLATYGLGSFIVASAGILDGREAATVWWMENELKRSFPAVRVKNSDLITEDERIFCAGAASSLLYLIIKLIEKLMSPTIAMQCARATQANAANTLVSPYLTVTREPAGNDPLVNAVRHRIERSIAQEIRLSELAAELKVSPATLIRRFKHVLGVTPQSYIQNIRIEMAKQWLQSSQLPIDEIVARIGYSDTSSFTRLFRQRVGVSPGIYRERFGYGTPL